MLVIRPRWKSDSQHFDLSNVSTLGLRTLALSRSFSSLFALCQARAHMCVLHRKRKKLQLKRTDPRTYVACTFAMNRGTFFINRRAQEFRRTNVILLTVRNRTCKLIVNHPCIFRKLNYIVRRMLCVCVYLVVCANGQNYTFNEPIREKWGISRCWYRFNYTRFAMDIFTK